MAFVILLLALLASASVTANVVDSRMEGQRVETESKMFEIDKMKLQQYWQYATTMSLIKAHTRSTMKNVPHIERVVFEQCANDAKTVISLAKCAVRVFDARQYSQQTTTTPRPFFQLPKTHMHSTNEFIMRPKIRKIKVSPAKQTVEKPYLNRTNQANFYYSVTRRRWVKNPIRKQLVNWRVRRKDNIMDAYELYLEEQRNLKKAEDRRKKLEASNEKLERNLFGLPRHMSIQKTERQKRDISDLFKFNQSKPPGTQPSVDFGKLASKYFRHLVSGTSGDTQRRHLENIRRLRSHYLRVEKCNGYFKLMNDENRKVYEDMNLGINSKTPRIDAETDGFQKIIDIINQFSATEVAHQKFSFLSPRFFSIMPEGKGKNRFLSPTLLSFQRDGFFSLPDIFEIVSSNQNYQQLMLEGILDLSGAGTVLEDLLLKMEPNMKFMEEVQYPMVQQLSRQDINWLRARNMFDNEQAAEYEKYGIAHLTEAQVKLVYADDPSHYLHVTNLSRSERESRVETEIRKLAAEGRPQWPFWNDPVLKRKKRDDDAGAQSLEIPNYPHGEDINGVEFLTLKPHAFANLINFGVSMEAMILSPHAFISEIIRPEALKLDLLSPRAFVATILSPSALIARILSPTAFRAEVLSPRALTAWVLSPEALVAEVLSPRVLEPRVLSPEALVIDVLSPGLLAPHVMSSEAVGIIILSPNILSPRIASEEKFLVEILSPHVLGGPHSEEEEKDNIMDDASKHASHEHKHGDSHGPGTTVSDHHLRHNGILNSQVALAPPNPFAFANFRL